MEGDEGGKLRPPTTLKTARNETEYSQLLMYVESYSRYSDAVCCIVLIMLELVTVSYTLP